MPSAVALTKEQIDHVKAEGEEIARLTSALVADINNLSSKEMLDRINEIDGRQLAISKLFRDNALAPTRT